MTTKFRVVLTVEVGDAEITRTMVKDYVREAVSQWGGQYEPPYSYEDAEARGHPLFGFHKTTVKKAEPV